MDSDNTTVGAIASDLLPNGIRSSIIPAVNGLDMHVLEAGFADADAPCLLLLHGFPELAYSWRRVMLPLAEAGYHVIAPDQRGYGRTTGWQNAYDMDLSSFRLPALVRDMLALLTQMNIASVDAVIGHDFGSPVAAWCALIRPDIFKSVALMSAPFEGSPVFESVATVFGSDVPPTMKALDAALSRLDPPRKHYQHYFCTPEANTDMCRSGVHLERFLRAYFHFKSADWPGNTPQRLVSWDAGELGRMPVYYIMERDKTMVESVAQYEPDAEHTARCKWMTPADMAFYSGEFDRTGFQGGLNWYRCTFSLEQTDELRLFEGRTIDVPSMFIAGAQDWGIYQRPGGLERMQQTACTNMKGCEFIRGAGHWVQQEQPAEVVRLLLKFLQTSM
ncbi:MAG: alpha/beta hydrolase [Granulosicoccus sp.]|nr:alpha/beta hydrolase [Granulosicoccus sp.]